MRIKNLFFVFLAGILLFLPQIIFAQDLTPERIISFDSYIVVNRDSTMTVVETIKVHATGDQIRHGIYRDFPTRYKDRLGNNYVVGFDVLKVERDGQPEGYHFQDLNNGRRVYFGKKEVLLSPGNYTYTFVYKTNRQLGFFKDKDELYWNVTGNGWAFSIEAAKATVELPAGTGEKIIETTAYTGVEGTRGADFEISKDINGNPVFRTTRTFMPMEGLTVVVAWPKGFVSEPSFLQKVGFFLKDNEGAIFILFGIFVILLYYLSVWYWHGRDPQKGTIIPLFNPPRGLSPAAARYVFKMGYDNKAFTAAVINMAVKGYLTVNEKKEFFTVVFSIKKAKNESSALTREEESAANSLFAGGDELALTNTVYQTVQSAMAGLKSILEKNYEKMYFFTNAQYFLGGIGISGAIFFLVVRFLNPFLVFILALITIIINVVFFRLLKAPTLLGRKVMDEIEGFKMYLSVAEKERLNLLNPPERTPELFEKYLPYALALDVEQHWAQQFSDVFKRLHDSQQAYAPRWYNGSHWNTMAAGGFATHLSGSFSNAIASSSTPPGSSSGGGGGGSSGGGGGGGGGGGW